SKRCCAVAQRLIYTRMTIVDRYAMLRFMRRAMDENRPQIREFIQHINFSIEPISNSQARFRFKPRYGEVLDEIAARDFRERDNIDEAIMYSKSVKVVSSLLKKCPNLQTFVVQFKGFIQSFDKIKDGKFPRLHELI